MKTMTATKFPELRNMSEIEIRTSEDVEESGNQFHVQLICGGHALQILQRLSNEPLPIVAV